MEAELANKQETSGNQKKARRSLPGKAYISIYIKNFDGFVRPRINSTRNDGSSLGGPQPYVPVAGYEEDDELAGRLNSVDLSGNSGYKRARVLCSYDAKDGTELNLTSNEVIFVCECNPPNSDYMNGKQGLLKGLVPKAFLELLDD
ncbi:conserved hypothetical protein [Culex quinquefasciatus]|uniref:SH3 domain-containing protein n=1 Tax=Culex quinquefasciatus TaxID=7176 RepID=B0X3H1_CULQU|nr:conserved hypothetical protein [Culex quinquefasciatus]|eukprot:XP_001864193.1 conserved hypothetical protein [Culex quinquefasciatus]